MNCSRCGLCCVSRDGSPVVELGVGEPLRLVRSQRARWVERKDGRSFLRTKTGVDGATVCIAFVGRPRVRAACMVCGSRLQSCVQPGSLECERLGGGRHG